MMPVKIIIVDDEPIIVKEASETLTDEGYDGLLGVMLTMRLS
jgi:CheY-like chemotaxis protein